MSLITKRISSINNLPSLSDVTNRINFLTLKNKAVNKKIIAYAVNSVERNKLSDKNKKYHSKERHYLQNPDNLKELSKLIKEEGNSTK